ncbi:unnamed protein product [Rodentolepis nana]|uniref:Ovule protein n=1 Tax=Rodentolepis nana TaxID=102285 RepID=A0A0R3T3D3_RODNA|nr:unnamed protein product [Rodentolepis nana]
MSRQTFGEENTPRPRLLSSSSPSSSSSFPPHFTHFEQCLNVSTHPHNHCKLEQEYITPQWRNISI